MINASTGAAFTGSVTVYVTGDAGTQAIGSVGSGACTHEGNGYHTYAPAQAETNYDLVAFTFTGTGAVPVTVQVYTTFPQTGDSYARLGAPAGASIAADIATVDTVVDGIQTDLSNGTDGLGAIKTAVDAVPTAAAVADAVLDEALSGHTTAGTLGKAVADIETDATAILADTNELQTNQGNWLTATGFSTHSAADVWSVATRVLTANTNLNDPTAAQIADAVWAEAIADHSGTAGSTAEALNGAGSAGDPWTTTLPGSYTGSQAGKILSDILTDTSTTLDGKLNTAQADLNILTGTDGVTLATSQPNYAPATVTDLSTKIPYNLNLTTSGNIGVNWAAVQNPSTTVTLSGTTVGTATSVTNMVTANTTQIEGVDATNQINAGCDAAIETYKLHYLLHTALPTSWGTNITANSALDYLADNGTATFDRTTDSLQALRDHVGDGTNLTEVGGDGDHLTAINLPDQTMNITGNITGNLSGSVGSVTGAVGSVTGAVGSVTGSVGSISGVSFPTNFGDLSITATTGRVDVAAVAGTAQTAGDIPSLVTTVDTVVDTINTKIGTPGGASLSADVTLVLGDTNELQTDWANGGRLDLIVDAILAMLDDGRSEPAQGAPPVNADMATKVDYLYKWARNKKDNDGAVTQIYADNGTTVDHKFTTAESGGVVTTGEIESGP